MGEDLNDTGGTNENGPGCTAGLAALFLLCIIGGGLVFLVVLAGGS